MEQTFHTQAQQEMKELGALVLTAATKAIHALGDG